MDPLHRILPHVAHVVVGTGGRLVRKVDGKQGRPVVFDHHNIVLRHVDGRREVVVTWRGEENLHLCVLPTMYITVLVSIIWILAEGLSASRLIVSYHRGLWHFI